MFKFVLKGSIEKVDVIELHGPLLERNVAQAREKFSERLNHGVSDIVLLCQNMSQIDNGSLSLLIEISETLQARGGKVHLVGCPLSVILSMKSLGTVHFFQFYKTEEEAFHALGIHQKQVLPEAPRVSTVKAGKRQVSIKDHVRNKMILFKHHENAQVKDIALYLQSTYDHFRDRELQILYGTRPVPLEVTLAQLFNEYGYHSEDMLEVEDITPVPPNYREMMKRGGKLFNQAVLEIMTMEGNLDREVCESARSIADLNQEPVTTTLIEGEYASEPLLLEILGKKLNVLTIDLSKIKIPISVLEKIPREKAVSLNVVCFKIEGDSLGVAMVNPFDPEKNAQLAKLTGHRILSFLSSEPSIKQKIEEGYPSKIVAPPPPIPEEMPKRKDRVTKEMAITTNLTLPNFEETGYFQVPAEGKESMAAGDLEVSSKIPYSLLKQYPVLDTLPLLLSESMAMLQKLERTLASLQKWHQLLNKIKNSEELLEGIFSLAFSLLQPDRVVVFWVENDRLVPQKIRPKKKSPLDVPEQLLLDVKKNKHLAIAKCGRESELHIAVPMIASDALLGIVYICHSAQSAYDEDALKLFTAFVPQGALVLENLILKKK